ncbi:Hint domain-containing protein [Paracoccus saliphilus]|uniref:Hint domain-containing protein n=1 Tax=Paracoccus saliphilus TaxID=405559 RepID=A0AA45W234_9RHOB|nr:Hint domain-containing protein [Paracoccus saliphilus]WCR01836.1 Hint domain-containing protein [Paracoccus saliphilus]SIS63997.1 type I secretion C-terminal target domain (VC_A0849 subclass) [Paracoccus saliphilus]
MVLEIVDPNSTEDEHLTSVDVKFSGMHIGGGIYFSANHDPAPGGGSSAIPQRSLMGEAERHGTTELDYTLPEGGEPWDAYRDDTDGDGTVDFVKAGFDMSMHVGDRLASTGEFYDGPAVPLLIANDPNDLSGTVTITGYPGAANSLDGQEGTLHQASGTLTSYTEQDVNGDIGGYFRVEDADIVGGMSGGANYLDYDADGDGTAETYLIGTAARVYESGLPGTPSHDIWAESPSFSPHYADLASAIEGLSGDAARSADDFARMTLLSAQTAGSTLTTVQGQFFHEDIYGGVNADSLLGAGGDDRIFGGEGGDSIDGGTGADYIDGGDGDDSLTGGAGADWFAGEGLGGGAADLIADFEAEGGDVIDLGSYFQTMDDVVTATTEMDDGSILIDLSGGSGDGFVQVLNTTTADLNRANLNVICFTDGTMIRTVAGEKEIGTLQPGEAVPTYDGSAGKLRALHSRTLGLRELQERSHLWPVVISAGALGEGVPRRDMRVSPQHRILVNSRIAGRMTGSTALIPAKALLDLPGVSQPCPDKPVTYIHLVFETHEIIEADGCWSESFYPGEEALHVLPKAVVAEYAEIFGDLGAVFPAANLMKTQRARRLVTRHIRNGKPLQNVASRLDAHG